MNFSLAFFHGEQALIGFGAGIIILVICVPLVCYIWLRHTNSSERTLTLIYVVSMAVVFALIPFNMSDPTSSFGLTLFTLALILSLPWNVVTLAVISFAAHAEVSDREFVATMLLGAGLNTMLVYYAAKKVRSWKG
jgi:hypothetical protein